MSLQNAIDIAQDIAIAALAWAIWFHDRRYH